MSVYPTIEELPLKSKNKVLFKVQRSPRSTLSHIFLAVFLSVVVFTLNYHFPDFRASDSIPVLKWISFRWLAIFPAVVLLEMIRKYHDDMYIFGKHRITHLNGRLSLSYSIPVVKYQDIRAITVTQDVIGRMFNYGNVEIGTAAQEGAELTVEGVLDPWELADLVDELRSRSRNLVSKRGDTPEKTPDTGPASEPVQQAPAN